MDLNNMFLVSELIALWLTIIVGVVELKWSIEDRKDKKKNDNH